MLESTCTARWYDAAIRKDASPVNWSNDFTDVARYADVQQSVTLPAIHDEVY